MAGLLKGHNVDAVPLASQWSLTGWSQVRISTSDKLNWGTALLTVPPGSFEFTVRGVGECFDCSIGVAGKGADLTQLHRNVWSSQDVLSTANGLMLAFGTSWSKDEDHIWSSVEGSEKKPCPEWYGYIGEDAKWMKVHFDATTRKVFATTNFKPDTPFEAQIELPEDDYVPLIWLDEEVSMVTVEVVPSLKRKRKEERAFEACRRQWDQREFCDGVVVCGGQRWEVNRCIICSESEVLRAAFRTPMAEAEERCVTISLEGVVPQTVEIMLKWLYTKELGDNVDVLAFLPLVHFYQLDLVKICVERMVNTVTPDNVVETLRLLKKFRDSEDFIAQAWTAVVQKASQGGSQSPMLLAALSAL